MSRLKPFRLITRPRSSGLSTGAKRNAAERGTTVREEAEAFVEFATKARQTERAAKAEKAARTDFRWIEIEANLDKARRALEAALRVEVDPLDDEHKTLIGETLGRLRATLNFVEAKFVDMADIDWGRRDGPPERRPVMRAGGMTNATIDHLNSLARFLVANPDGVTIADINAHVRSAPGERPDPQTAAALRATRHDQCDPRAETGAVRQRWVSPTGCRQLRTMPARGWRTLGFCTARAGERHLQAAWSARSPDQRTAARSPAMQARIMHRSRRPGHGRSGRARRPGAAPPARVPLRELRRTPLGARPGGPGNGPPGNRRPRARPI